MIPLILGHRARRLLARTRLRSAAALLVVAAAAAGCGLDDPAAPSLGVDDSEVIQSCRSTNVQGAAYDGTVCGGSTIDNCSKGLLYTCRRANGNNCTFKQSCAIGCITGPNSTPVTVNTPRPVANDACYNGPAPLTLSSGTTVGGNYVTMTATLPQAHTPYAVVNLEGTNNLVPPVCDVPMLMPPSQTTLSFVEPTGPVTTTTSVPLNVLLSFNDSGGRSRVIVSVPTPLTLTPGGSVTIPPLASFTVTDGGGAPITVIPGGGNAFTNATIAMPAPVGGVNVTVTTSPAGAFTSNGSFVIPVGCARSTTSGVLTATSTASSSIAATITATSGAGSPFTRNVTITPPALDIQSVALNPQTVTGGNSVSATVTLNRNVLASDPSSVVSIRLSEGLVSGSQLATFPGCAGAPACTGPATVPVGSRTVTVSLSTQHPSTQDIITVAAMASWALNSASRNLTINP
jgi:hypothetical protein